MRLLGLVVVVMCLVSTARAEDSATSFVADTVLSQESSDLWTQMDAVCSDLRGKDLAAYKKQRPAAAPIVDYCRDGTYPLALLSGNPDAIRTAFKAVPGALNGEVTTAITTNGSVPSLGGIADTLARGLTTVLLKRAKAELQTYVVKSIQERVCTKPSINRYLENTCGFLGNSSESFGITIGSALRSAIVADVAALPENVVNDPNLTGGRRALAARTVFTIVSSLVEHVDLKMLSRRLNSLATSWICDEDPKCRVLRNALAKATQVLKVASVIAERVANAEREAVRAIEEAAAVAQPAAGAPTNGAEAAPQVAEKVAAVVRPATVTRIQPRVSQQLLRELLTTIQTGIKAELGVVITEDQAIQFRDQVLDAMALGRAWLAGGSDARRDLAGRMLRSVMGIVQSAFDLAEKDQTLASEVSRLAVDATILAEAIGSADLGLVFTLAIKQMRRLPVPSEFDDVVRILSIGVELAGAKSSDEIASTIETVAAPMGSYRRKRFDVSRTVGGLVGFGLARERITDHPTGRSVGPVGLVGVDLTWPLLDQRFVAGAFISLFDLGAIFADQKPAGDSKPADIEVEQLVSLGAHMRLGTKYTGPLVLHGGVSWVPNFRTIEGDKRDVIRVIVGLSVDVTLFPF